MSLIFLDVKHSILTDLNWFNFRILRDSRSRIQHLSCLKSELNIQNLKIGFVKTFVSSIYSDEFS
jgi:hypothetical protein